jgi:hypothetical protein
MNLVTPPFSNPRRSMLAGLASAATMSLGAGAAIAAPARTGPGVLTVSGAIGRGNRGQFDPVLDQLLKKHAVRFDAACEFDSAMLARLPAVTIQPTLEYDGRVHKLAGPTLASVVEAAGVPANANVLLGLRAIDGYVVIVSLADARSYRMLVATTIDDVPLALGGLGPQWAVYDADRLPAFKDKPLAERFALCPWGLYSIEVKAA